MDPHMRACQASPERNVLSAARHAARISAQRSVRHRASLIVVRRPRLTSPTAQPARTVHQERGIGGSVVTRLEAAARRCSSVSSSASTVTARPRDASSLAIWVWWSSTCSPCGSDAGRGPDTRLPRAPLARCPLRRARRRSASRIARRFALGDRMMADYAQAADIGVARLPEHLASAGRIDQSTEQALESDVLERAERDDDLSDPRPDPPPAHCGTNESNTARDNATCDRPTPGTACKGGRRGCG